MLPALRLTLAGLATASVVLLGAAGCTGLDAADAASITHDDLISELATQLAGESSLTYTAAYQMTGGGTTKITQAQKPTRTVYAYPTGTLIVTPAGTVSCEPGDHPATCAEAGPTPSAAPDVATMVTPRTVLSMLNTAALDDDATATQHDTTMAGRHATCLDLALVDGTPAREFTVCVTNEGALGSFVGTINGKRTDLALTTYADKADPTAFTIPAGATLIDKRPK
ncbi:hypothetical protein ACWKSP_11250 [Micromonosporaceae bacterium Da 78-11]